MMIPGEIKLAKGDIVGNTGRVITIIDVINRGDRPVQVGSHFHFYEVNPFLEFDRSSAYGRRLNIPAGTAVRFEPGDAKSISLVPYAGKKAVYGFRNLVDGPLKEGGE